MTGMEMQHHTGQPGVAVYLGMWMLMMVPMMLPSLVPVLVRYRRSVRAAREMDAYGLTALVIAGYFAVWAVLGVAAWAAGAGVMAAKMRWGWMEEWQSVAVAVVLLVAGVVQFSSWKARQLARWHEVALRGGSLAPGAAASWRHGFRLGALCSVGCGNLMLGLLAIGMMNAVAMVTVTIVISAERYCSRVARLETAPYPARKCSGSRRLCSSR